MAKIWLDWSDGRYSTRLLTDEEAQAREDMDLDVAHVEDAIWQAYLRDCERDAIWQALWCAIRNEQATRRREKELMPLEDAEREIRRLKDDLAQAKRMWSYFEGVYMQRTQARHRDEHLTFTCIYPQPGCQIDALPAEWREHAQELLEQYRPDHAEEGMKYQGCCCGHQHKRLDNAEAQKLREAGFLIEHHSETL